MLVSLAIRDVVLIDRLDLNFENGLCVLTGETGAGKSILLDALGLALGSRADSNLLRPGAERAAVTATFDAPAEHPAHRLLAAQDLPVENEPLVLRRVLGADGRSRAFVNDQPVSVALLRRLGDSLIELQGQFEQRGLLDPANHRDLVDTYGGSQALADEVAQLWQAWQLLVKRCRKAEAALAKAREDETFLRHAVEELDALAPQPGESEALTQQRSLLQHGEKVMDAIAGALAELTGADGATGAETSLAAALRRLERASDKAGEHLAPAVEGLQRALAEAEEAVALLQRISADLDLDPAHLQAVEERFFALKDMARKHGCEVDALAALRDSLAERLAAIDGGGGQLEALQCDSDAAREAFVATAEALSAARQAAAERLDQAVNGELPPLKLEKARFATRIKRLAEEAWSATGIDQLQFEVATNPGAQPGPIGRIASGGELSRFLLALKVVLAASDPGSSLVFDEVDSGIGGATAHAVGERLARLAVGRQVLVVTHSPQVAARASHHWRVQKESAGAQAATRVEPLQAGERREEIARMLAGAEVTEEARAAADRLMGTA